MKRNSVDDGVRIWKQKKEGIENAINQDWKIYSYISFLVRWVVILLFSFDSFFFLLLLLLRSLPPISFFRPQEFSSITPLENQLYFYSSLRPFCTHPPPFLYNMPRQCRGKATIEWYPIPGSHTHKKKNSGKKSTAGWHFRNDGGIHVYIYAHTFIYAYSHKRLRAAPGSNLQQQAGHFISTEYYVSKEEKNSTSLKNIGRPFAV